MPLHRYVVFELKTGPFRPEHLGQLGFYMTAIDNDVRGELDGNTIGVLLCQEKNQIVAEYALQDSTKPMGVAEYRVLPPELSGQLPSVEQLEQLQAVMLGGSRVSGTAQRMPSDDDAVRRDIVESPDEGPSTTVSAMRLFLNQLRTSEDGLPRRTPNAIAASSCHEVSDDKSLIPGDRRFATAPFEYVDRPSVLDERLRSVRR